MRLLHRATCIMAEVPLPIPTQVPVPSTDIRNAVFAGAKLDEEVTGSGEYYTDRLGVKRLTNTGRNNQFNAAQADKEARFQQFLLSSGYVFLGDYEEGPFQFSARNQYIRYDNQYYRLNAATDVGFTTTGTDATNFANDVTHFVMMDGDTLRQNLSSGDGAKLIGGLSFLTVEMYSYLVEGNDWRKATQAAIDRAHQNYLAGSGPTNILIGGNLIVTLNPDSTLIPGEVAAGRGALCMRSGVTLMGGGSITLDGSFTGSSSGAIITNWEGAADNCKIQGITLNGSRGTAAGTGITCINIVDSDNVTIDNVKAIDSTSGGIYLRRANNTVYGCSNSRIINCYVHNVGYIGIQCERPNGMTIAGCAVTSCGDNGIDLLPVD